MSWTKSLRLNTKVTLAICCSCIFAGALVAGVLTALFIDRYRQDYDRHHQAFADQVALTLHELEAVTDMAGMAVLTAFREQEAQGNFTSIHDLREFTTAMGVSAAYTYSGDGLTALWTHAPADANFCVFDMCGDYTDFFSGSLKSEITPFVPVARAPSIKFFKALNKQGDQILTIAIYNEFLDDLLKAAFRNNSDLVDIDVRTPSGISLRPEGKVIDQPNGNSAKFLSRTSSTVAECCQCVKKGFSQTRDGYFYNVVVQVSRAELDRTVWRAYQFGLVTFAAAAVLSLIIARFVARNIVARIESIDRIALSVFKSGDLNVQLPLPTHHDEIGRLQVTFNAMLASVKKRKEENVEYETACKVAQHARQVAHDIRSPLAAIRMALSDLDHASEETRNLLRSATYRIEDISHQLFDVNPTDGGKTCVTNEAVREVLLPSILQLIVSEKRTEYRQHLGVNIEFSVDSGNYGLFAALIPADFKRVISNMVNNAVEALNGAGTVKVFAKRCDENAMIEIIDDGCGMPLHVLEKLGREEISYGKKNGHGIGVFSAQAILSKCRGRVEYVSEEGHGTCARVSLNLTSAPRWFMESLYLGADHCVVIADDDLSIHRVWDERFRRSAPAVRLKHISSTTDLTNYVQSIADVFEHLFLVDYEFLGERQTGIDLVEKLNIVDSSVLVTSRFEEDTVLAACQELGLRMIPKSAAEHVPIIYDIKSEDGPLELDAVFLDDDRLIRQSWMIAARRAGLKLKVYASESDFAKDAARVALTTPIYVDFDLNSNKTGLQVAEGLAQKGFSKIFLATGFSDQAFGKNIWLAGVIGKTAPF